MKDWVIKVCIVLTIIALCLWCAVIFGWVLAHFQSHQLRYFGGGELPPFMLNR